jgi:hypothetical protein
MYGDDGRRVLPGSPFANFVKDLGPNPSLKDAEQYVRGYIEACSSPLALELDEAICKGIGGHIHVATITPSDGFRWVVPPLPRGR